MGLLNKASSFFKKLVGKGIDSAANKADEFVTNSEEERKEVIVDFLGALKDKGSLPSNNDTITSSQTNISSPKDGSFFANSTFILEEGDNAYKIDKDASHAGEYFTCKGALCKCDSSVAPTLVELLTQEIKYLVNENKAAATISDNVFKAPFGSCSKLPYNPTCPYAPSLPWQVKSGDGLPSFGAKLALPEKATLQCPIGGKITIEIHGQEISVSDKSAEELDPSIATALSCLSPQVGENLDKLTDEGYVKCTKVSNITLNKTDFLSESKCSSSNTNITALNEIPVYTNHELTFVANTNRKGSKFLTKWLVYSAEKKLSETTARNKIAADKVMYFEDETAIVGTELKLKFQREGLYYIEGFGGELTSNMYANCTLLVRAFKTNKLNKLTFKEGEDDIETILEGEHYLIKRKRYLFKAHFLFPLDEEQKKHLKIQIIDQTNKVVLLPKLTGITVDKNGKYKPDYEPTELQPAIFEAVDEFIFVPINTGIYTIQINYGDGIQQKYAIHSISDDKITIEAVDNSQVKEKIRPNTPITYIAQTEVLSSDIVWWLNGQKAGKGKTFTLPCPRAEKNNELVAEISSIFTKKIKGDLIINVLNNHICSIDTVAASVALGQWIKVSYTTYHSLLEGSERIKRTIKKDNKVAPTDSYKIVEEKEGYIVICFLKTGNYSVDFSLERLISGNWQYRAVNDPKTKKLLGAPPAKIAVKKMSISKWNFKDKDGDSIPSANSQASEMTKNKANTIGWGHQFDIEIVIDGLNATKRMEPSSDTVLKLWHKTENGKFIRLTYDSKLLRIDKENGTFYAENIGDATFWKKCKDICQNLGEEKLNLCFTLNGGIGLDHFSNLTIKDLYDNACNLFADDLGRQGVHEELFSSNNIFLQTPDKTYYKGWFADEADKPLQYIISYADSAKAILKAYPSMNDCDDVKNSSYLLQIIENMEGSDTKRDEEEDIRFDEYFSYVYDIPVSALEVSKDEKQKTHLPRFFYLELYGKKKGDLSYGTISRNYCLFTYPESYGVNKDNDQSRIEFTSEGSSSRDSSKILSDLKQKQKEIKENTDAIQDYQIKQASKNGFGVVDYVLLPNLWDIGQVNNTPPIPLISVPAAKTELDILYEERNTLQAKYCTLLKEHEKAVAVEQDGKKLKSGGNLDTSKNYFRQLKIAEDTDAQNSIAEQVGTKVGVPLEKYSKGKHNSGSCPRCKADITLAQMQEMFPDVDTGVLQKVATTYNKYMIELKMDTCWQKAHFFAQVAVETGWKLDVKKGEGMGFTEQGMYDTFPSRFFKGKSVGGKWQSDKDKNATYNWPYGNKEEDKYRVFQSKELSEKAKELLKNPVGETRNKAIANFVYATTNGNTGEASGDGWRFRGSGLIQLTGRGNFKDVQDALKVTKIDMLSDEGAEKVRTDLEWATLSAMGYFLMTGMHSVANKERSVKKVCEKVGHDTSYKAKDGKDSTNHTEKTKFFDESSSKTFEIDECSYGEAPRGDTNQYRVDIDLFKVELVQQNVESAEYQYLIYEKNQLIQVFTLSKSEYHWVQFPETGKNWGRYGDRDTKKLGDKGDNWIQPQICAHLFGFFYSLPLNNFHGTLLYNDINAYDGQDIGHSGHRNANDIDIRYPGSRTGSEVLYSEALKQFKDESEFVKVLENILEVATKWGFNTNYVYKSNIKYAKNGSHGVHQNHFHLGFR